MTTKIIAHALLTWTENGRTRTAFRGEEVDLPDEVVTYFERFGAFEPEHTPAADLLGIDPEKVEPADVTSHVTDAGKVVDIEENLPGTGKVSMPDRPKYTAPKDVWVSFAAELHEHTSGALGFDHDTAAEFSVRELIAALNAQTEEN